MRDAASALVRRLWHYCNILRDDGLSYPDYVEQLTYLLFLKMADEQDGSAVPAKYAWRSFSGLDAATMHRHYGRALAALGEYGGTLGVIFRHARNKIEDPAKLRLLVVDLIGQLEWSGLSADLKGDAYEGLLEKNARDTKSGAGQYFTPRPLIEAIVECVAPRPGEVICDPACGTGGFLLSAREYMTTRYPAMNASEREHLRTQAIRGVELVPEVARLAAMNLLLHGVASDSDAELPIICADSLKESPQQQVDVILTNPPFGVKGTVTYTDRDRRQHSSNEDLTVVRPDFWVQTSNKQLNFVQHVTSALKPGGRAAVILPDNVLFEAGAAAVIRRRLLQECDVHTLLRLPTGLFYAQGVKANVLFFTRPAVGESSLGKLRVYDLRSGNRFSLKTRPLQSNDLAEFVRLYGSSPAGHESASSFPRWRTFLHRHLAESDDCRFDMTWEADVQHGPDSGPSDLGRLDELARLISDDLKRALLHIAGVAQGPI